MYTMHKEKHHAILNLFIFTQGARLPNGLSNSQVKNQHKDTFCVHRIILLGTHKNNQIFDMWWSFIIQGFQCKKNIFRCRKVIS